MVTTAERRQAAIDAVQAVLAGSVAGDVETELIDFKIEEGRRDRTGSLVSIGARHEPAASQVAKEAGCLANTTSGGALVIGVDDRASGPSALVGAETDADWLRGRIYALTQPPLTVDVEEIIVSSARLLIINVPDGLAETYVSNRLRTRVGTQCVELTGDRARQLIEARRGYDWSAEPSGMRLSQASQAAIESAAQHYDRKNGSGLLGSREVAARLRLLIDDEPDPELNRAGALLLCRYESGRTQLDLQITDAEGAASRSRFEEEAPLLLGYDGIMIRLLDIVFPGESRIIGGESQIIRALPELAIRESLVNAIMHRDYRIDRATIVALAIGNPSEVFKVRSPGGFPPGVLATRLLATQSSPRNPALADAIRRLGLAEGEGVGIDSMFRVMLRDGHPEPEIVEGPGEIVVRLSGGVPDLRVRELFDGFAKRSAGLASDVRAAIAIDLLTHEPVLRPERLAAASQATLGDAIRTLEQLETVGGVERLLDRSRSYRLSKTSRSVLSHRITYGTRTALEDRMEHVEALLDVERDVSRADLVEHLKISGPIASRVLSRMVDEGRIEGTTRIRRGKNMRYRRVRA